MVALAFISLALHTGYEVPVSPHKLPLFSFMKSLPLLAAPRYTELTERFTLKPVIHPCWVYQIKLPEKEVSKILRRSITKAGGWSLWVSPSWPDTANVDHINKAGMPDWHFYTLTERNEYTRKPKTDHTVLIVYDESRLLKNKH